MLLFRVNILTSPLSITFILLPLNTLMDFINYMWLCLTITLYTTFNRLQTNISLYVYKGVSNKISFDNLKLNNANLEKLSQELPSNLTPVKLKLS